MLLKTILNRLEQFKSFVYGSVRWAGSDEVPELEVWVIERRCSRPRCSQCSKPGPGYDRLPQRRFD